MGMAEVASRNSFAFWQHGQLIVEQGLRFGRRMVLLFLLLCLSPGLVVIVPLVAVACATPLSVILLSYAHLPRLWAHVHPYAFKPGLPSEAEKEKPATVEPERTPPKSTDAVRKRESEIVSSPASPTTPGSGYLSAEDSVDSRWPMRRDRFPDLPPLMLLEENDENMTWGARSWIQESLASSASTSPSYYSASPSRSPYTPQDEGGNLVRKIRRDIVGLKRFVGDKSPSQGPLMKEIEDLGTFLGIDLPITGSYGCDLEKAKECLDLLKLVVGVQFR